jgi:phosphatidylserine/phosphatidylglycerophosphate/cardiolipin synthase-like enzyme
VREFGPIAHRWKPASARKRAAREASPHLPRLALIDSAAQSVDLQYYLWKGDAAGDLLGRRLIQAADRGVRVRLLVDDFLITGDGSDARVHRQPAQSGWQRAADWFFGLFPLANQI